MVHFWIAEPLEHSPPLPPPEKPDEAHFADTLQRFLRVPGRATPDDEAFVYLCKLCCVDSEALILLRDPGLSRPPLEFAFTKYRKYLELMDSIPESIRRVKKVSAAILLFQ
jgi:hypothetical protein